MRSMQALIITLLAGLTLSGCGTIPELLTMKEITTSEGYRGTAFYRNGVIASEELATRPGGQIDMWRYYDNGKLVRMELDNNRDGNIDSRLRYNKEGILILIETDKNFDGKFESVVRPLEKRQSAPQRPRSQVTTPSGRNNQSAPAPQPSSPEKEMQRPGSIEEIVKEEPATPMILDPETEEEEESFFQPITPRNDQWPEDPRNVRRSSGIVPGPVFTHPSDNLED